VARNGFEDLKHSGGGFNPYAKWTLTSAMRPANADGNIDAFQEARRLGWSPDQVWRRGADNNRPKSQRADKRPATATSGALRTDLTHASHDAVDALQSPSSEASVAAYQAAIRGMSAGKLKTHWMRKLGIEEEE
jgi:hypothetical protein